MRINRLMKRQENEGFDSLEMQEFDPNELNEPGAEPKPVFGKRGAKRYRRAL